MSRHGERLPWPGNRRAAAVLRAAREASGRSRKDVADAAGWAEPRVRAAEEAITRMSQADALALAAVLGVDPEELGLEAAT